MALPAQSYVWFRLRYVIGAWVLRETGLDGARVLWGVQGQPRSGLPFIGLTRRSFPTAQPAGSDDETITEVTLASTLTVTASAAGETAAFLLFGLRYAYTLSGGDTTEDARDALLALVEIDRLKIQGVNNTATGFQPCTALASGTDEIDFAGLALAPVAVKSIEGCAVTPTSEDYRKINSGSRRALVKIELFWPEQQDGFDTLDEYMEALRSSLQDSDTALWLHARGVGVEQGDRVNPQNSSRAVGGAFMRSASMDVIFNADSKVYRPAVGIAGVNAPEIELIA